jgi:hypothetical protein
MSFQLQVAEIEKAREIAKHALDTAAVAAAVTMAVAPAVAGAAVTAAHVRTGKRGLPLPSIIFPSFTFVYLFYIDLHLYVEYSNEKKLQYLCGTTGFDAA